MENDITESPAQSDSEPTVIEKPEHNFALYAYQSSCEQPVTNDVGEKVDVADDSSETGSAKDVNVSFTISVIATDLTASEEMELRNFINKKITKGALLTLAGVVGSVSLQASDDDAVVQPSCHGCYHRLYLLDSPASSQNAENMSRGFIVCFLSKQERGLELFQHELDKYCDGLLPQLDQSLSNLETSVKTYLESWFTETVQYVNRCVALLGTHLQYIIYAALVDMKFDVCNTLARHQVDLQRFLVSCSLTEMLHSPNGVEDDNSPLLVSDACVNPALKLTMDSDSPVFSNEVTTPFCQDWAETLIQAAESNPFCLRQIVENYKLKVIQDMNHLRRLLRQAENDHYALFRTYSFLKSGGNGEVLLHHAKNQTMTTDSGQVVCILDDYIQQQTNKTR